LFCLAISILFLAQTAPITLPTTPTVGAVADTAAAPTTAPIVALTTAPAVAITTAPATEASRLVPATSETTQVPIISTLDAGKAVTVKGAFTKVDAGAKTISVKTDAGEETYYVTPSTAITIDGAASNWDGLAAVGQSTLTITATPGKVATSIVAETPSLLVKLTTQYPLLLFVVPVGLFLLMSVRNKRKQEKAQQEKLGSIKRGDRIQTIGGIIGNVVQTDEGRVLVKVDESNNTKIWFARSAVGRVLGEEKSSDAKSTK